MATKKKPLITAQQVTDNLRRLFPEQVISCSEVSENWNDTPTFYIETNIMKVAVVGKQVLEKPSIKRWADYIIWCNETGAIYSKTRTKLGTCIPFVYRKGRDARKKDNECSDLILMACGLKAAPKPKNDALKRISEIAGKQARFFTEAYKVLKGEQIVRATLKAHETFRDGDVYDFQIATARGNYKFMVDHFFHEPERDEIRAIFAELLGITVIARDKKETAIAA